MSQRKDEPLIYNDGQLMTQDEILQRQQRMGSYGKFAVAPRSYTELAPGVWSDPISERRNDFDGAQAGYEAALAQAKSIVDAVTSTAQIDVLWDAALDVAAHIAETHPSNNQLGAQGIGREIARAIRSMKRDHA